MPTLSPAAVAPAPPAFSHPADFYQTRDFGQKWEATAQLLRLHGRELLGAVLRYASIWIVAGAFLQAVGLHYAGTDGAMLNPLGLLFEMVGSFVVTGIVYGFMRARMHALDEPGARFNADQIWDFVNGLSNYFGSALIGGTLMVLGMICLLLPGLYIYVVLTLLPGVVLIEDGDKTLSRCFELIRGHFWSTAGLVMMTILLQWGVIYVPKSALNYLALFLEIDYTEWGWVLPAQVLASALKFTLQPITAVLLAFNYFSLVEAKESPGLQWRAARIGQAPPAAAPSSGHAPSIADDVLL